MLARILYYYGKSLLINRLLNSQEQLKHHQEKQFNRLVSKTLVKSPFYQACLNKPFEEWPIINKHIMMEHFDEINTIGVSKHNALEVALKAEHTRDFSPLIGNVAVGLSSGTSGARGLFLANPQERDAWAGTILAKVLPNGLKTKECIAFFLRANNNLYTTLNKSNRIQFHFFDLLGDFEEHIHRINQINPTILSAPASVLLWLARHKEQLTIKPKKICSVAEVLEKSDELIIKQAFQCTVSQIYQCTEGFLAISDKHTNRLTLNEEFLIIEKDWLDEKRFVPIITDLMRTTQPVIRYRLDDVLLVNDRVSIFTELDGIEGRVGDICYGQQGSDIIPLFADSLRQHMASSMIDFDEYRIIQWSLYEFSIQITPAVNKEQMVTHLNQFFKLKQCTIPHWRWEAYQQQPFDVKCRRINSCYNPDTLL